LNHKIVPKINSA